MGVLRAHTGAIRCIGSMIAIKGFKAICEFVFTTLGLLKTLVPWRKVSQAVKKSSSLWMQHVWVWVLARVLNEHDRDKAS